MLRAGTEDHLLMRRLPFHRHEPLFRPRVTELTVPMPSQQEVKVLDLAKLVLPRLAQALVHECLHGLLRHAGLRRRRDQPASRHPRFTDSAWPPAVRDKLAGGLQEFRELLALPFQIGIKERRGSILINSPPTVWQKHSAATELLPMGKLAKAKY